MLRNVIEKYVNMGGSQYLRDYRMSLQLKKSAELRKKVMERNNRQRQKIESVPFKVSYKNSREILRHNGDPGLHHKRRIKAT